MINIGKVRIGSSRYYTDTVAKDRLDYYLGRGEAPGYWIGSLAPELGLAVGGRVDPDAFHRLLAGRHPVTGEMLLSAAGSNERAKARSGARPARGRPGARALGVTQVAVQLAVSPQAVRQWLAAGEAVRALVQAAAPEAELGSPAEVRQRLGELEAAGTLPDGVPLLFLLGGHAPGTERRPRRGWPRWFVSQTEVDRLRRARRPPGAQAGWDLVFRPPKSYSILWAVGGPELGAAILAAHREAVAAAVSYLEDAAVRARVTVGRRRRVRVRAETRGLVAACFEHRDSRAGDPLLHTHCVVANPTRLLDGRWRAMQSQLLYRHGLAADAVYQATFRQRAEHSLGLESEAVVNGWADVAGVPREVIEHFSKRSAQIAAATAAMGTDSPAARQAAALDTRAPKEPGRDLVGLHDRWRAEASALGFDECAVAACLNRTAGARLEPADVNDAFAALAGPRGLTAAAATFTRADVIRALAGALGAAVDGAELVRLADRFLGSGAALALDEHRPGRPKARMLRANGEMGADLANAMFTTPEVAAMEHRLMALAADGYGASPPVADSGLVATALAARPELNDEQRAMVEAVATQPRAIRAAVGYPGAGKTYATEAVVAALVASGVPVVGCAVTAEAADELSRSTGLGRGGHGLGCDTIAKLLYELTMEGGTLPAGTVVVVDEASTASHRDLDSLARHVTAARGALILVGDPQQHSAVGPGHFFGWLVEALGDDAPHLTANQRQRDLLDDEGNVALSLAQERLANVEYREGKIAEALARRDAAGLVVRAPSAAELYDVMAADWWICWREGSRDPMIATRNAVREELNHRARLLRQGNGELLGPSIEAGGRTFAAGEWVVARWNRRDLKSPVDSTWFVKNGSRGEVVVIHEGGAVSVDFQGHGDARHRVQVPADYLAAGHVEWAYAVTDYGVQGRTLDRSRAVLDETTTREGALVATTRGRLENRVYIVDGPATPDPEAGEVAHVSLPTAESNLDAIAEHLAAPRAQALVHEIDPAAADAASVADTADLGEIEAALAPLEAALADVPHAVDRRIAGAEARRDEFLARRRVHADPRREPRSARQRSELASVDAGLARIEERLVVLREAKDERDAYLAEHADELARREILCSAMRAREARVRLGALRLVPEPLRTALPEPGPGSTREERRAWREAMERAALHLDRHPYVAGRLEPGAPPLTLGTRPDDPGAALSWDLAMGKIDAARQAAEAAQARRAASVERAGVPSPGWGGVA